MILYLFFIASLLFTGSAHTITILLDPAYAGRTVYDSFEHGLTMQCAQALQKEMKAFNPNYRVILSRTPGESVDESQRANFANRLNVDLFIHISFCQSSTSECLMNLYRHHTDPTDDWSTLSITSLNMIPLYDAHKINSKKSKHAVSVVHNYLRNDTSLHWLTVKQPIALAYKPLGGLIVPALGIEMGIAKTTSWKALVKPLAHALCSTAAALDTYES